MAERATSPEGIDAVFPEPRKTADRLRALAHRRPDFEVFEDTGGNPYMRGGDLRSGALATWNVRSVAARNWLVSLYLDEYDTTPGKTGIEECIAALSAEAAKNPRRAVNLRVGVDPKSGNSYIDRGTPDWTVVELDASTGEWDIVPSQQCPIVFRRTKDMQPLPDATHDYGDGIKYLRLFINFAGEDFEKYIAFLTCAANGVGPYPGLAVSAKKESGKSQYIRRAVQLIDPNVVEKNAPPRRDADLMTIANNRHLLSMDNISFLASEVQDLLSILSTGGGKQERGFHQQDEVHTINVMRPWATTGIGDYITKSDTLRRTFLITPPPMTEFIREEDLQPLFEEYAPKILGHIYTALARALKAIKEDRTRRTQTTSLADIERLMEAAGPTFGWKPGHFTAILRHNATAAAEAVIETNSPVVDFMASLHAENIWEGTASDFLTQMNKYYEVVNPRIQRILPKDPGRMSRALADVTDELQSAKGWRLTKSGNRTWRLDKNPPTAPTEHDTLATVDDGPLPADWFEKYGTDEP